MVVEHGIRFIYNARTGCADLTWIQRIQTSCMPMWNLDVLDGLLSLEVKTVHLLMVVHWNKITGFPRGEIKGSNCGCRNRIFSIPSLKQRKMKKKDCTVVMMQERVEAIE